MGTDWTSLPGSGALTCPLLCTQRVSFGAFLAVSSLHEQNSRWVSYLFSTSSLVTEQRFAGVFCCVIAGSKSVDCHVLWDSLPGCVSLDKFLSFTNRHTMLIWCLLLNTFYFKFVTLLAAFVCSVYPLSMWDGYIFRMQLPVAFSLVLSCFVSSSVSWLVLNTVWWFCWSKSNSKWLWEVNRRLSSWKGEGALDCWKNMVKKWKGTKGPPGF